MSTASPRLAHLPIILATAACLLAAATGPAAEETPAKAATGLPSYMHFESEPVRPIALSADGTQLFVTNISDARLEIFWVKPDGIEHRASVPVGLEPVTVAVENEDRVWVVNHLSDSISIVDLGRAESPDDPWRAPRVVRTLLVGDEPRDLVFAGTNTAQRNAAARPAPDQPVRSQRAFLTTARRGQNSVVPVGIEETSSGRANVWVYDTAVVARDPAPKPLTVLTLFGDTPRGLAVSPDQSTVYAAVFKSGNRTTTLTEIIDELMVLFRRAKALEPKTNHAGDLAPHVSRILQEDPASGAWLDVDGNDFNPQIPFTLPDVDVFAIDALAPTPHEIGSWSGVGAVLFNLATHPRTGEVFVTNTFANNMTRFEGPGNYLRSLDPSLRRSQATVQGKLHLYRISILGAGGAVDARRLNKHIDYDLDPQATEASGAKEHSLATPLDLVFSNDGKRLYVAAFGSSKIGVFDVEALRKDSFTPAAKNHIALSAGGPAGLALDEQNGLLYTYSRFENAVVTVRLGKSGAPGHELAVTALPHNPEPAVVRAGRRVLYDARLTSSNGEASCSSCHIFGGNDGLAWDLGNPDDAVTFNNTVQRAVALDELETEFKIFFPLGKPLRPTFTREFHPMKGPMMTQTLRGMDGQGPLHWRGDRRGGVHNRKRDDPESADSLAAFKEFNVAFEGLLGRHAGRLSDEQMTEFARFHLAMPYPPNPIRALDNTLSTRQANGRRIFMSELTSAPRANSGAKPTLTCNSCHVLDPPRQHFGSAGMQAFDALNQMFKVPHLRELYQKIGMSGQQTLEPGPDSGPAVRGYGLNSDGFVSSAYSFVGGRVAPTPDEQTTFQFPGDSVEARRAERRDVEQFLYAFDTDTLPAMGQQVTLTADNADLPVAPGRHPENGNPNETVRERIDLLRARALHPIDSNSPRDSRPDCDLVAKAVVQGKPVGFTLAADGRWASSHGRWLSDGELRALAGTPGQEITFTCVPPGSGLRMGLDRDLDGVLDGAHPG